MWTKALFLLFSSVACLASSTAEDIAKLQNRSKRLLERVRISQVPYFKTLVDNRDHRYEVIHGRRQPKSSSLKASKNTKRSAFYIPDHDVGSSNPPGVCEYYKARGYVPVFCHQQRMEKSLGHETSGTDESVEPQAPLSPSPSAGVYNDEVGRVPVETLPTKEPKLDAMIREHHEKTSRLDHHHQQPVVSSSLGLDHQPYHDYQQAYPDKYLAIDPHQLPVHPEVPHFGLAASGTAASQQQRQPSSGSVLGAGLATGAMVSLRPYHHPYNYFLPPRPFYSARPYYAYQGRQLPPLSISEDLVEEDKREVEESMSNHQHHRPYIYNSPTLVFPTFYYLQDQQQAVPPEVVGLPLETIIGSGGGSDGGIDYETLNRELDAEGRPMERKKRPSPGALLAGGLVAGAVGHAVTDSFLHSGSHHGCVYHPSYMHQLHHPYPLPPAYHHYRPAGHGHHRQRQVFVGQQQGDGQLPPAFPIGTNFLVPNNYRG